MQWKELVEKFSRNTLVSHLGIELLSFEKNILRARMPVDARTKQSLGILHGGATCTLIETVGTCGAILLLTDPHKTCVGLELNVNHLKKIQKGYVLAEGFPLHQGKITQVWDVKTFNEEKQLLAAGRITLAVIDYPHEK